LNCRRWSYPPGPTKWEPRHSGGANQHPWGEDAQDDRWAGPVGSMSASGVTVPADGGPKNNQWHKWDERPLGNAWEAARTFKLWPRNNREVDRRMANRREVSEYQRKRADFGVYIKTPPPRAVITERADPSLVTQG
jgi:hypothetical protein